MNRKLVNPSASRNREPILQILKKHIDQSVSGFLLEISSGVGTHAEYFAPNFPNLTYQPTEYDIGDMDSLRAYAEDCPTKNILEPLQVDVRDDFTKWGNFQPGSVDYMLNINMIHISEFACTEGLFRNAGQLLKNNGLLITYGPYAENGLLEPESNVRFDAGLRANDPTWGIRDIADLKKLAEKHSIFLKEKYEMPANNKTLIWKKEDK